GQVMGCAPKAEHCISFFCPKRAHVLLPAIQHIGQLHIASIGISDDALDRLKPEETIIHNAPEHWQSRLHHPQFDHHKYTRGHVFVHGGTAHPAAAHFAAKAALRAGAGYVSLSYEQSNKGYYFNQLDSIVLVHCLDRQNFIDLVEKSNALVIGPGSGINYAIRDRIIAAMQVQIPMVIDADGLSVFEGNWQLLAEHATPNAILTPHHGEFMRIFASLMAEHGDPACKVTRALLAAKHTNATIIYKGFDTVIALPDGHAVVNTNGSPYLATAGSGDVLCGIIAAFLAQKISPFTAACAACWVHGALPHHEPQTSWIAEDLIANIPKTVAPLLGPVPRHIIEQIV
ncbi:MAG: NAD(P)H-hydrate dehydratase, partial [Pseudomonadota bacterium]